MTLQPIARTRIVILAAIVRGHAIGRPPSVREMAEEAGVTVNAVQGQLKRLQRDGMIARDERHARTLRPTCRWIGEEHHG